jgi:hypothetical protein
MQENASPNADMFEIFCHRFFKGIIGVVTN